MGTSKRVLVVTTDGAIERLKEPVALTTPVLSDNGTKPVWIEAPSGTFSGDASDVPIVDAGGYFMGTDVEAALQELGAGVGGGGNVATDTLWDAKGDLAAGTGANTASKLTVGANDTILMADSAQATGLKWVASATPSTVGTANSTGTADTFTRGDHVHAHEAAHVAHDTLWDTKGDIVVATGADTASKLAVGTDTWVLTADSGQATGVKWAAPSASGNVSTDTLWNAKGDLAVGTGSDTAARLGVGTNGDSLIADSSQTTGLRWAAVSGDSWTTITKAIDESVTTTTLYQADDELLFTTVAARWYYIDAFIIYTGAAAGDLALNLGETGGAGVLNSLHWSTSDAATQAAFFSSASTSGGRTFGAHPTDRRMVWISGAVLGNGGAFTLRWAQASSNGTATTVHAGSVLRYRALT